MLIAHRVTAGGRRLLIVGLQDENMQRLRNDMPIHRPLDEVPGMDGWDLYVLGPEDLVRFMAAAGGRGGPPT